MGSRGPFAVAPRGRVRSVRRSERHRRCVLLRRPCGPGPRRPSERPPHRQSRGPTTAGTTLSVWPRCLKGVGRGVWQGTGREATADGAGTAGGAWAPRLRCVELGMSEAAGRARSALGAGHETGGRSGVQGRDPRFKKQKHVSISTDVRPAHRKSRSMSRSESLAVAPPISL
jgi:hypothetical protein